MKIIPTTVTDAFAKGDILQVLLFAILFGAGLSFLGERDAPVVSFIERTSQILFEMMCFIVRLAPLGRARRRRLHGRQVRRRFARAARFARADLLRRLPVFVLAVLGLILRHGRVQHRQVRWATCVRS